MIGERARIVVLNALGGRPELKFIAMLVQGIPRSVRVSEAPSYGQTVVTYDPTSPGALGKSPGAPTRAAGATPQPTSRPPPATAPATRRRRRLSWASAVSGEPGKKGENGE